MRFIDRKVPVDDLYFIAVASFELGKGRLCLPAKRTLKILELDDSDRRLFGPLERRRPAQRSVADSTDTA